MLIGTDDFQEDINDMVAFGHSLTGQIAVGVQIAHLHQQLADIVPANEWDLITRRIHDGIASSMSALRLHLGAYAELARRDAHPFTPQLEGLVLPTDQLLLDTRLYLFYLLPALRGESGLAELVEGQSREFERVSGLRVHFSKSGSEARLPATAIAGFFHVLQARLSNLMKSASASRITVHLAMWQNNVQLAISDDGEIDDHVTGTIHGGYHPLQQIANDMGGTLEISTSRNEGNRVVVVLSLRNDRHQD